MGHFVNVIAKYEKRIGSAIGFRCIEFKRLKKLLMGGMLMLDHPTSILLENLVRIEKKKGHFHVTVGAQK